MAKKTNKNKRSGKPARKISKVSRSKARKASRPNKAAAPKVRKSKMFEIPHYPQTEEFTSSAACALMVLKYLNPKTQMKKDDEFKIWQEAVNGSVWHGSRYGLAYALSKRGAKPQIISNAKEEGYEKKLAVYEGVNIETLSAAFKEIKQKAKDAKIKESYGITTINTLKKHLNGGKIPIVVVNANALNPYLEDSPHWVVVKGYDNDTFYINDPYSDSTITMAPDAFKGALGYDNESHMILVSARKK